MQTMYDVTQCCVQYGNENLILDLNETKRSYNIKQNKK